MISDVLFEAAEGMRHYLETMPETYASIRPELDKLLHDIEAMQAMLDRVPGTTQQ